MKPFFEVAGGGPNPTFVSATDQSITVSNTLEINMFVNRHVIISLGGVSQTMYITGNDEHTIYVD